MNRAFLIQLGLPVGIGFAAGSALPIAADFNPTLVLPAVLSLPVIGVSTVITGVVFGDRDEMFPKPLLLVGGAAPASDTVRWHSHGPAHLLWGVRKITSNCAWGHLLIV